MATLRPALQDSADVTGRSVKRNAAHRNDAAFGQRNIENLRSTLRIFEKHFVEIAEPEKQKRVLGQFAFDAAILRHHRCQLRFGGHRRRFLQNAWNEQKILGEAKTLSSRMVSLKPKHDEMRFAKSGLRLIDYPSAGGEITFEL